MSTDVAVCPIVLPPWTSIFKVMLMRHVANYNNTSQSVIGFVDTRVAL